MPANEVIEDVVSQYAEEAAFLWARRDLAVRSGNHRLSDLADLDERLAAHIEGLIVSGMSGWRYCEEGLRLLASGEIFAAAVIALETCDQKRLKQVIAAVVEAPKTVRGACSAFGWANPTMLKSTVSRLLGAADPIHRQIGVAACALHRVDPGLVFTSRVHDDDPLVRSRSLRAAGELGASELLPMCLESLNDPDTDCRFWAAWSSVLLGDRSEGLDQLRATHAEAGPRRLRGFRLTLQAMDLSAAHAWLARVAAGPKNLRWLIQGSGIVGDPLYVPWLVANMQDPKTARVAGEAFALITGADFEDLQLVGSRPPDFVSGPTDDPDDPDIEMDPDSDLPWPNPERVERWWQLNGKNFPRGMRSFMGAPVTPAHCIAVLKAGYQSQRVLAAQHLALLNGRTQLFNTGAPAWRQQGMLEALK